jgi:hypothetical protein
VPVAAGLAAWTVAGLGMGLAYAPISLMMLREAPPGREGWASASLNLADVLGTAIGIGAGGAALAATADRSVSVGVTAAFAIAAAVAVMALALTRRLPPGPSVVDRRRVEAAQAAGIGAAALSEGMVGAVPDIAGHDAE